MTGMSVFATAIKELSGKDDSEPESFKQYWTRTGQRGRPTTAAFISVQTRANPNQALADEHLFPFRLGRSEQRGTAFALARSGSINDFFLLDDVLFTAKPIPLKTDRSPLQQFQFQLIPKQVKKNAVNLTLASGAISQALSLDGDSVRISPAGIASTFTFPVRPTKRQVVHQHVAGQVEIDAAIIAKRNGKPIVIIIEAKHGGDKPRERSLAKTKLTYPLSVILRSGRVPSEVPVLGVYLRTRVEGQNLLMNIAVCDWPGMDALRENTQKSLPAVTALKAVRATTYSLKLPESWPSGG